MLGWRPIVILRHWRAVAFLIECSETHLLCSARLETFMLDRSDHSYILGRASCKAVELFW